MANIIEIKDFDSPYLDIYARLSEVQLLRYYEPDLGIFLAESTKVIERALNAGYEPISLLMEHKHINGEACHIIERCGDIPVYTADYNTLKELTGFELTRGILCAMRRKKLPEAEIICQNKSRIAVMENVMNPTNIGAIFRSAAALNMDAVLLTSDCCNPLYRRAIRVSMGTVFQIPWTILDKDSYINTLHSLGYKIAAMALRDDTISINDPSLLEEEKLAIVLGSEGDGLTPDTIASCDYTIKIPMAHNVDSLNVAAASAVAFWQLGKH